MCLGPVRVAGSSPLARGLLRRQRSGGKKIRIIPARAGFTLSGQRPSSSGWDHPRSRGVYSSAGLEDSPLAGSSPLARGLPARFPARLPRSRIIPARAGFTGRHGEPHYHCPGSSPLARGLRCCYGDRLPVWVDHPRSRGVYKNKANGSYYFGGSSPLARGLHSLVRTHPRQGRIIPARAGFTGRRVCGVRVGQDHPRSRGVYTSVRLANNHVWGSSPLARGLPHATDAGLDLYGIIPARAGFTKSLTRQTRIRRDHPRSRGVYRLRSPPGRRGSGSSPLARGLREDGHSLRSALGIIPARAGFTLHV